MPVTVAWQVAIKFQQFGAKWSETFYSLWANPVAQLRDLILLNPVNVITQFRASSTVFTGVSIRRTDSTRNSIVGVTNVAPAVANPFGPGVPPPDVVRTTIPFIISAPNGQGRKMSVRGLPDASTLRSPINGRTDLSPIKDFLDQYYAFIQNNCQGAIRHTFPPPSSGVGSWQNVISLGRSAANPNWTDITLVGGSLLPAPGTLVQMRGFTNATFTYLHGDFVVKANPTTTSLSIPATWREPSTTQTVANVQLRQHLYQYDAFDTSVSYGQLSSRKTADPTNGLRGARSKTTRRRLTLVVAS